MLGENRPMITPTQKDSRMSSTKQSDTLSQNQNPTHLILLQRFSLALRPCNILVIDRSGEVSGWDQDSGSDLESCSDSDSHNEYDSASVTFSEKSLSLRSKETLSEIPKDHTNLGKTSPPEPDQVVPPNDNQIPVTSSNKVNDQKANTATTKRTTDKNQTNKKEKGLL